MRSTTFNYSIFLTASIYIVSEKTKSVTIFFYFFLCFVYYQWVSFPCFLSQFSGGRYDPPPSGRRRGVPPQVASPVRAWAIGGLPTNSHTGSRVIEVGGPAWLSKIHIRSWCSGQKNGPAPLGQQGQGWKWGEARPYSSAPAGGSSRYRQATHMFRCLPGAQPCPWLVVA